jgi:hypothetical protein
MQNLQNKFNNSINLDILKRLNYIYKSIIPEDKTLEYAKQIDELIYNYKSKSILKKKKNLGLKKQSYLLLMLIMLIKVFVEKQ